MASGVARIVLRLLYALTSCKAPLHLALSTREIFDVHIVLKMKLAVLKLRVRVEIFP